MTDDIVTRLREQYFTCDECFGLGSGDCSRCETDKEAADEIERLRKENEIMKNSYVTVNIYEESFSLTETDIAKWDDLHG